MNATSRAHHSIRNARYGIAFYLLGLLLSFAFRRYFIYALGADLLGLNSTAQNLLGFLNVAELGLASAIAFALYKPLYDGDREQIKDIVSIQGWFYRLIALVVIAGSIGLLFFFPQIFAKVQLPIWYAYATFAVLLYGSLLSYFFNYRQVIFTSDQRDHKVTLAIQAPRVVKLLLQTIVLYFRIPHAYIWWLILEALFATLSTLIIERSLRRDYPWLSASVQRGSQVRKRYPEILRRTKQLIYHKMAGFVLLQSGPLLVFAYTSPKLVTVYTNYLLVMMGLVSLADAGFRGISGSVGNLIASGNQRRVEEVFRRLYATRLWFAAVVVAMLYIFMDDFVSLWVGPDLRMESLALWLWLAYTFQSLIRLPDTFISAYGLYQDIWAPITEAVINLSLSIVLGYYYGLVGILIGINVSMLLIVHLWKPIFLYSQGFRMPVLPFFGRFLKLVVLSACVLAPTVWLYNLLWGQTCSSYGWVRFVAHSALMLPAMLILSSVVFYVTDRDIRDSLDVFFGRIRGILSTKRNTTTDMD